MRILKLFELEEWYFLFSLLISLDIIQGPPLVACSNLLVSVNILRKCDDGLQNFIDGHTHRC